MNKTATLSLDGQKVQYAPSPRWTVTVMTTPSEVVEELAKKFFGHGVASIGSGVDRKVEQVSPHVFRTTCKAYLTEGVQVGPNHWSYVDTRTVVLDWEAVEDYN
jgi:hypothetical protein